VRISDVRLFEVSGLATGLPRSVERQVGALDLYDQFRTRPAQRRASGGNESSETVQAIYVQVDTDDGVSGIFGPIFQDQAYQIDTRLRPLLLGADALAVEKLWDIMARHDRHGRKGYMMMAISAVDIALWDLRGKAMGLPVYRILGGPTRDAIPAYASMLGHSLVPEDIVARAQAALAEGYGAQKWFFRYGPGEGRSALEKNMALVRTVREAVGPNADIMFDAWMGWDLPFSVEMGRRMADYSPRWMEEPLQPDRIESYAELRRQSPTPVAAGEHVYTRWGFFDYLRSDAIDVIQADPDWTGGITEMLKICALASAYGRQVIPHGHSVAPALHVIASQSPAICPMLEYLEIHNPQKQFFHKNKLMPQNGIVQLPMGPGIGIELDPDIITDRRDLCWH